MVSEKLEGKQISGHLVGNVSNCHKSLLSLYTQHHFLRLFQARLRPDFRLKFIVIKRHISQFFTLFKLYFNLSILQFAVPFRIRDCFVRLFKEGLSKMSKCPKMPVMHNMSNVKNGNKIE